MAGKRRPKGLGAINRVRDRAGRLTGYQGVITLGITADGKRIRRKAPVGRTRREAQENLEALRRQLAEGTTPATGAGAGRLTVGAFLGEWLAAIKPPATDLRERTWEGYAAHARLYLSPRLGRLRLAQLGPKDIEQMYAALRTRKERPLSASGG